MWNLTQPQNLLFVLAPLAVLGVVFLVLKRKRGLASHLSLATHRTVLERQARRTRLIFRCLFAVSLIALGFAAYAASRPVELRSWAEKFTEGIDIVLVLDVSESMEATDLAPNRISSAKKVIREFIERRNNDRIGLVIFGGEAVTKSPLTRDYQFLLSQVEDVRLRELKQGTAIGMGLANGIGRLRHSESKNKVLILLTDGDSNVGAINPITATHLAKQEGIKVYTIGIGKDNRVLVPIYAYDRFGKRGQLIAQVPSYINPELLQEISKLTGGKSYMARDSGMLARILREIDNLERTKIKILPKQKKEERFFWPAFAALLLLFGVVVLQETRFRRARVRAKRPLKEKTLGVVPV